jgi:hypothetical protein
VTQKENSRVEKKMPFEDRRDDLNPLHVFSGNLLRPAERRNDPADSLFGDSTEFRFSFFEDMALNFRQDVVSTIPYGQVAANLKEIVFKILINKNSLS